VSDELERESSESCDEAVSEGTEIKEETEKSESTEGYEVKVVVGYEAFRRSELQRGCTRRSLLGCMVHFMVVESKTKYLQPPSCCSIDRLDR